MHAGRVGGGEWYRKVPTRPGSGPAEQPLVQRGGLGRWRHAQLPRQLALARRAELAVADPQAAHDRRRAVDRRRRNRAGGVRVQPGAADLATTERPAFGKQLRPGRAMDGAIDAAAAQGADADQLLRVAYCESRYNPGAYNASGASGLFQFLPSTWAANSVRAGFAGASVFDPVAAANVAAWMFVRGQAGQWVCR